MLEHVSLELQTLAGSDVSFGRVVPSGDEGVWWVIVAYEEEAVGVESMHEAARIVRASIDGQAFDAAQLVARSPATVRDRRGSGPSTSAIVEEARRRGIPVRRLNNRSLVQLGLGRNLRRIQATVTDRTSSIAVEIAQDKDETKRVIGNIGLPVPKGDVVRTSRTRSRSRRTSGSRSSSSRSTRATAAASRGDSTTWNRCARRSR